jgi:hypothetical protein
MKKHTYRVEFLASSEPKALQELLNTVAAVGYRCVHFQPNPNGTWILIFEMPVAPAPP